MSRWAGAVTRWCWRAPDFVTFGVDLQARRGARRRRRAPRRGSGRAWLVRRPDERSRCRPGRVRPRARHALSATRSVSVDSRAVRARRCGHVRNVHREPAAARTSDRRRRIICSSRASSRGGSTASRCCSTRKWTSARAHVARAWSARRERRYCSRVECRRGSETAPGLAGPCDGSP